MPTLTLAFKGNTLQVIPLHDGVMTIGREPSSDIHIDSLAISPQHARLLLRDGDCTLQSNTGEETFVNQQAVNEQVLQDNDLIRIGKHTLRYTNTDEVPPQIYPSTASHAAEPVSESTPSSPPVTSNNSEGYLQVLSGSHLGKTIKLRTGMTDLGKAGIAPALISLRRNGYYIANLGENDNLHVSDENIGEKTWPLKDGDLIQIDKLKLQFYLEQ